MHSTLRYAYSAVETNKLRGELRPVLYYFEIPVCMGYQHVTCIDLKCLNINEKIKIKKSSNISFNTIFTHISILTDPLKIPANKISKSPPTIVPTLVILSLLNRKRDLVFRQFDGFDG